MPGKEKSALDPTEILVAEFEYIAQSAFQANEDRARVTSFYLLSVGSILAAILSAQVESLQSESTYAGFSFLFLTLTVAGILTLLQLIRLRIAWRESAIAMNTIKDHAVKNLGKDFHKAFRWNSTSLPSAFKSGSVSHLLAIQVSLLSAIVFAAAIFYLLRSVKLGEQTIIISCGFAWVLSTALMLRYYRIALSRH